MQVCEIPFTHSDTTCDTLCIHARSILSMFVRLFLPRAAQCVALSAMPCAVRILVLTSVSNAQ
jgi:hypothetical protein